jgi:ATP-binding cassette subfamily F protein uup
LILARPGPRFLRPLLQLSGVSLAYGHVPLLESIDLVVEPGERIGFIGRNGTGKSTLLRIIAGEVHPDDGKVWRAPDLKLAAVPQEPAFTPKQTVFEAVAEGLGKITRLLLDYHAATHALEQAPEDQVVLQRCTTQHRSIPAKAEAAAQVESALAPRASATGCVRASGGTRARRPCALVLEPQLLLDEPSNHLDVPAIERREDALLPFPGSVLCRRTIAGFWTTSQTKSSSSTAAPERLPGNFSAYQARKAQDPNRGGTRKRQSSRRRKPDPQDRSAAARNEGRVRRLEACVRPLRGASRHGGAGTAEGERSAGRSLSWRISKSFGATRVVRDSPAASSGDKVGGSARTVAARPPLLRLILRDSAHGQAARYQAPDRLLGPVPKRA